MKTLNQLLNWFRFVIHGVRGKYLEYPSNIYGGFVFCIITVWRGTIFVYTTDNAFDSPHTESIGRNASISPTDQNNICLSFRTHLHGCEGIIVFLCLFIKIECSKKKKQIEEEEEPAEIEVLVSSDKAPDLFTSLNSHTGEHCEPIQWNGTNHKMFCASASS